MARARASAEAEFSAAFAGLSETGRRSLLKAMGATLGLAGLAGCAGRPDDRAYPYVRQPEFMVPDEARHYATAVVGVGGYAQPVLGTTHVGRPTKLEGLPEHPASLGAADAFTQAAILGLYDPDRSQTPRQADQPAAWGAFDAAMVANARALDARRGEGLRILTGQQTSPTFARQLEQVLARWPGARWHVLEAVSEDRRRAAAALAFGRSADLLTRLDRADAIVSFDDDLLGPGPHQTRNARLWSQRRQAYQAGRGPHGLWVAEPTPSLTGVTAQARLAAGAGRIAALCAALAARFGIGAASAELSARERAWLDEAAAALQAAGPRGLVSVGAAHPPEVQALGLALNRRLGAFGSTLDAVEPVALAAAPFSELAAEMAAGAVDTLFILDANPAYAAPPELGFAAGLKKVRMSVHAGLHRDETARLCRWHAPAQHDLETWSDARAIDGSVSLIQPLVRPFFSVRSRHALVETLQGRPASDGHDLVMATWRAQWGPDFDARWMETLRRGFVDGSASPGVNVAARPTPPLSVSAEEELEVVIRPDPCVWDGRFAANPMLQELPKPLNKVTWSNVVALSAALAGEHGVENGDMVRVEAGGRSVEGPAWITPGQAARTVTLFLGYGRRTPDLVGDALGYDACALLPADGGAVVRGARLAKTGARAILAVTQPHQAEDGHGIVLSVTPEAARGPKPPARPQPTFYPPKPTEGPQYGMSIDTDLCIGCNACVAACDAENNVAIVGAELVAEGRQMHWLRIDHYADGDPEAPVESFQPVPCMHCEHAPCEMGCPVNATSHAPDGLNLQVYNRCIGTRTCSSYCPYKVRRFNWFDYTGDDPPARQAQRNPEVTVRSRGVMEKCTYCIQRVSRARIRAKIEGRPVADGEVRTACQQTCPTEAIVFGDVSDPQSAVSRRKAQARDYCLLPEENTRPRTTYLARIRPARGGRG